MLLTILMATAVFLFALPFFIFPLVLKMLPRGWAVSTSGVDRADTEVPTVALVICALNEERIMGAKMENSLALDYPRDKFRIVVISDGSTDRTAEIVRGYQTAGVELIDRAKRRGKVANLNDVLPTCPEEILVLSDANVMYKEDAIRRLVSRFQDPSVGCVSGKVILTDTTADLEDSTGRYYSLEWMLQERSSEIYSMAGADGAMYALRRELFQTCPDDTLIEDFVIAMAVVRQGKRVVFEPHAIGWEPGVTSVKEEFRRKVRIAAGSAQTLIRGNAWPGNAPLRFWLIFAGHKLLRWTSPVIGLLLLTLCLVSSGNLLSTTLSAGFFLLVLLAAFRAIAGWAHPLFNTPFYFLFAQVALIVGLWRGLLGRQSVLWAKADR